MQLAHAGTLASISLSGASAGVSFSVVGTGFNATAASNVVTFTSFDNTSVSAPAASVGAVDPTTGARRLTLTIPAGVKVGTARVGVTNTATGEISDTRTFEVLGLSLPNTTFAAPGSTGVAVRIVGSPNTNFLSGSPRAAFGAGVTVTATNVESATSVVAIINVSATAALGTRDVGVTTGTQTALLAKGFTIGTAPANQAPHVDAGQEQTITLPADASLQGHVTDDGLPVGSVLTREWTKQSGPGTVTFGNANAEVTSASFSTAGTYVLRLTATDTALPAFGEVTITVQAAAPINRAPVATNDTAATNFETPLTVVAPGVLGNDSDPDAGDTITALLAAGPGHAASFALNPNGSFAYTPAAGFSGSDSFTYRAVDQKNAQSSIATVSIAVGARPNQAPHFTSSPSLTGNEGQPYSYQAAATDPDGDPLTFSLTQFPTGMSVSAGGLINWTPTPAQVGSQSVTVRVDDGRGGSDVQPFTVNVGATVTLQSLELTPPSARFSAKDVTRALIVNGRRSDQSTVDLTVASTGTTYESSNPFVATVSADGVVASVADGESTITARNSGLSATASMVVEVGVTLDSLDLSPAAPTLRSPGATQALTLRGHFSDQTTRDLTNAAGVTFQSNNQQVATVSGNGRVTALASGAATITGALDLRSATANVTVAISGGTGFLTGRVFDDTRGQPLGGALIELLADGGGTLDMPVTVVADGQGRFALPGRAGAAIVRASKNGFTTVERRGEIQVGTSARLLDARLTPIDARANAVVSVFGGEAHDTDNQASLQLPPGTLPADASLRITRVSAQGLAGRLPLGWSPVTAADVQPGAVLFAQGATLRLPNAASLAANAAVAIAIYDAAQHEWIVRAAGHVTGDGRQIEIPVDRSGPIAALVPDTAPFTPAASAIGETLKGVETPVFPIDAAVSGDVVPRSAPPGDNVRALGRVSLQSASPLPSGTALSVHVTEQFDLLDASRIVPLPFTEDILVHARPRPPTDGPLGATFPITPSRSYTIQELMLGVVKLDVDPATAGAGGTVVGSTGGSLGDADGDTLDVPAGALSANAIVTLKRLAASELTVPVPSGVDLLAGLNVDLIGASFAQPASLSITRAGGLADDAQILVAQAFGDPLGVRRLRVVGVGRLDAGRIVSQPASGALSFNGIDGGGEYVFLRPQTPMGFIAGQVFGAGGTTPRALALVTSPGSPFSDLTPNSGRYVIAVVPAAAVPVQALDTSSRDAATAAVGVAARDVVANLNLTLSLVVPTITSTSPADHDQNVPLDTSVAVTFSEPIDPASITDTSAQLRLGATAIAVLRTLSADRRRLVLRPLSPLAGKSVFSIVVTNAVRDLNGNALAPFSAVSFTTLDPSKPPQPPPGQITAELPDEDGFILVFGTAGTARARSAVTATNLRSQLTITVFSQQDGSFRFQIPGVVGDEIALTFRDASDRETTFTLTQLQSADGATAIGASGGTIAGDGSRIGRILPGALTAAGVFAINHATDALLPAPPAGFDYVDRYSFSSGKAVFNALTSLALAEGQERFVPQTAAAYPFRVSGDLTVPADFLVNASLQYTAVAQDRAGNRRSVTGSTQVVPVNADGQVTDAAQDTHVPTLHVLAPRQALPNQQIHVDAVAPMPRVDVDLPAATLAQHPAFLLTRLIDANGTALLSVVDRLELTGTGSDQRLRSDGREFPGTTESGEYVAVGSTEPLTFVTGRVNGPAALVIADGLPFAFKTLSANGNFLLPLRAGQAFTLRFFAADSGALLGTHDGTAPAAGELTLGTLLGSGGALTVNAEPGSDGVVDIGTPLTLRFSSAVDATTISNALVVTDAAGSRVFGTIVLSDAGRTATFSPRRRWRYGSTYRWGLPQTLAATSGARLTAAVQGSFATFAPVKLGAASLPPATGVGTTTALGLVTTSTGFAVVDTTSAVQPTTLAQVSTSGGANAAYVLTGRTVTDRNGVSHTGPLGLIAAGSTATAARLLIYDLATPDSPQRIGDVQLTTTPGVSPPAGVADRSGVALGVTVTPDLRALVSVDGAGLFVVALGQAVPADAANPGRGVIGRYPDASPGSVASAAVLGSRIVALDGTGLSVLDGATLQRVNGIAITGAPRGIVALSSFAMDVNGDGLISDAELNDLAIVAGGADGTVQLYRVAADGATSLLSVVHLPGEARTIVADPSERLAYVAAGTRGLAIVDLDGPVSVQPIDIDHDGVDDRILGSVELTGTATGLNVVPQRRLGLVSASAPGVTTVQLSPPRTRFVAVDRDPVVGSAGDEQSILQTRAAFVTDDALRVVLEVQNPGTSTLRLVIDEQPVAGAARVLSFDGGNTIRLLAEGLNTLTLALAPGSPGASATLRIRDDGARTVAAFSFELLTADTSNTTLKRLFITPSAATIGAGTGTLQLKVGGVYADGRTLNLTAAASGTEYDSDAPEVATVDANGLTAAVAGGIANVGATNGSAFAIAEVTVDRPAALVAFDLDRQFVTVRTTAAPVHLVIAGVMSDGSTRTLDQLPGTVVAPADSAVATATLTGDISAVANGRTTVTVRNGAISADVDVLVDLRTPASVTSVNLLPFTSPVNLDDRPLIAQAQLAGTGSLDGLPIAFTLTGAAARNLSATSSFDGGAGVRLVDLPPGSYALTASLVDPATGQSRTDTENFTVAAATADSEPNGDPASASTLAIGRSASGSVAAGTDARDDFRLTASADGTITVSLDLDDGTDPSTVQLVIRSANGDVLQQITPNDGSTRVTLPLTAAGAFASVEALTGVAQYRISSSFEQAELTITGVSPPAGAPGTLVTIDGSGFSALAGDSVVTFGGIGARIVSATRTRLQALVPANAVNGVVRVVSGSREAVGPFFNAGNASAAPQTTMREPLPNTTREDPTSGILLNITRLKINVDPGLTRAQVEQIAQTAGGDVAGVLPSINSYILEFAGNSTFDGLRALQNQLALQPGVLEVTRSLVHEYDRAIDQRESPPRWPNSKVRISAVWDRIRLFDAIDLVRSTPPFHHRDDMHGVKVAVIDDGFSPNVPAEFKRLDGTLLVTVRKLIGGTWTDIAPQAFGKHGTAISSVIGATNDGSSINGVLNGAVFPGEKPFEIVMYINENGSGHPEDSLATSALEHIRNAGDFDVVSMSFGSECHGDRTCVAVDVNDYRREIKQMVGRTLVLMSAGNLGVTADSHSPSALAMEAALPNTMSIGATAVGNVDKTGEGPDHRAVFAVNAGNRVGDTLCKATPRKGSNCSPGVTLTAPGEDFYVVDSGGSRNYRAFGGTSAATPAVAGVAALVQAVRNTNAPIPPARLRDILIDTADEISDLDSTWNPNGPSVVAPFLLGRVNALDAVRAVLPADSGQRIYVSDSVSAASGAGHIVGIEVNPLNGHPTGQTDALVDLVTSDGDHLDHPIGIAMAPGGERAYVLAKLGGFDAVAFVNTRELRIEGVAGVAESVTTLRPSMVVSKDGRLLYIATGAGLALVNLDKGAPVNEFEGLPHPYNGSFDDFGISEFHTRLSDLHDLAKEQAGTEDISYSNLALSPDGRTLYLTVQTGGGTGYQPGVVLGVNVDLYEDADPDTPGIQTDLHNFLKPTLTSPKSLKLDAPADKPVQGGDEPSAAAVSKDGKFLYLTNGGLAGLKFARGNDPLDPNNVNPSTFNDLTQAATTGLINSAQLADVVRIDIATINASGVTLLDAVGNTGVFSLADPPRQIAKFPSEIVHAWQPPDGNGGLIVNQVRFRSVFAKRPFGITIRPSDGNRALISFFQTGNFGVLDLEHQQLFPISVPNDSFYGLVGVTPSLRLDNYLWPGRGAYTSPDGIFVPSPDEALLFPTNVEYAQNGRFAVAVHIGNRSPGAVNALLPDFEKDTEARLSLGQIGFSFSVDSSGGVQANDPDGNPVSSFDAMTFDRGGGAITILNDDAISHDLESNANRTIVGTNNTLRPYYSEFPICETPDPAFARCEADAYVRVFDYSTGASTRQRFDRPRAFGIQPFVYVIGPRFADTITAGSRVTVGWRDTTVTKVRVRVNDLGPPGSTDPVIQVNTFNATLTAAEKDRRSFARMFKTLFGSAPRVPGHRYQLEIAIIKDNGDVLSTVEHELFLK